MNRVAIATICFIAMLVFWLLKVTEVVLLKHEIVHAKPDAVFNFTKNPENLLLVHPYATSITIDSHTQGNEDIAFNMTETFGWMANITITSEMNLHSNMAAMTVEMRTQTGVTVVSMLWAFTAVLSGSDDSLPMMTNVTLKLKIKTSRIVNLFVPNHLNLTFEQVLANLKQHFKNDVS